MRLKLLPLLAILLLSCAPKTLSTRDEIRGFLTDLGLEVHECQRQTDYNGCATYTGTTDQLDALLGSAGNFQPVEEQWTVGPTFELRGFRMHQDGDLMSIIYAPGSHLIAVANTRKVMIDNPPAQ